MKQILMLWCAVALFGNADGQIIITIAGNGIGSNSGDGGSAVQATINYPDDGAFDKYGNYYFTTGVSGNTVRKIDTSGIITTIAGTTGVAGYSGDEGPATAAELKGPQCVVVDNLGNIYISDAQNNRIRKVEATTGVITTIAGNGTQGYSGDNGAATAAALYGPNGVAVDTKGNLYIADYFNSRIRKVNADGVIATFAGTGTNGYNGDGGLADTSEIKGVFDICSDTIGNIYIADEGNGRIRKVDTFGIIHTIAGNGNAGYSNDGGMATNAEIEPHGITYDKFGNVYFSDIYRNRVRVVTNAGIINTVAGDGITGYSGDGGLAAAAELNGPTGVTTDVCGNLYICDLDNYRIRKVTFDSLCSIKDTTTHNQSVASVLNNFSFSIYPNPAYNTITITATTPIKSVTIVNLIGQTVYTQQYNSEKVQVNIENLPVGIYFVKVNEVWVQKVVKE